MSHGDRIPLAEAQTLAREIADLLAPVCERIEIAGSMRRGRATVADIELVVVPRIDQEASGLFDDIVEPVNRLEERVAQLRLTSDLTLRSVEIKRADGSIEQGQRNGPAYKALAWRGFPVDLFIVREPDVNWGVIFALRTGPDEWNRRLVEDCKRHFRRVEGGRVLHLGRVVPCPEERDFFAAIGQRWVDPPDRTVERVHIVPPERLGAPIP